VHVRVRNERYSVLFDFQEKLDRNAPSVLNVTRAGQTVATLSFGPPSAFEAWAAGGMDLKASVGFSHPVFIETNDSISIVSAVNKTGRLRVGG